MTGEVEPDEFDQAWDQEDWGQDPSGDSGQDDQGGDQGGGSQDQGQDQGQDSGQDQGQDGGQPDEGGQDEGTPDDQGDQPQDGSDEGDDTGEADEPAKLRRELERAEQRMKSWEGRLSKLARENEELKRRLQGGDTSQQAAPQQQRDTAEGDAGTRETGTSSGSGPAQSQSDTNSQADDELRERIREEFGDEIAQYVDERARQIAEQQVRQVDQRIAPLEQARQEVEAQQHWQTIQQAHPDVEEIAQSSELEEWINSQPSYVADAARQVVQAGTAQQVVELLDRFKAEKRNQQPSEQPAEQTASKARAVRGRSAGPPKSRPTQDFDQAWDEF